jgi:hypothetical protein
LLTSVMPGFERVGEPASGPMDADEAVEATIADASEKSAYLRRSGFLGGYSRVWTSGDDYITILVHDFSGERGAKGLVEFELKQLAKTSGFEPFAVKDIAGARGYVLSATKKGTSDPLFCQGVWFTVDTRAFAVNTCGVQPNTTEIAHRLAVRQWKRVR